MAAYLLGFDESAEETAATIQKIEFADGDDDKSAEKAGPVDLRFDVPPSEAIDYFKRKEVVTKKEFKDLRDEAKGTSFYISGVYQKDILEAFKMEITDALETGKTQRETIKNFKNILSGAGHRELGNYHLESIFRTNMQMAYGIGRRRALESVAEDLPFWTYNAVNDDRTRPTHRVLDGITLPYDHPFWDTHYPPWGFLCRCNVTASYALPENYNPNNPSGLGEIAYDDKEMPVKAEYDTQVLDLNAGKFVSVQPQGRLSDLIDFAKLRGQKLNYPTPQSVVEEENRIRFDKRETVSFYDQDGNKLFTKTGEPDRVAFDLTDAEEKLLKYSTMTHNHPNTTYGEVNSWQWKGVSFSLEDLKVATAVDVAELRAVGNYFRYSFRPGKNGWSKKFKSELEAEYNKVRARLYADLIQKIPTGEVNFDYITGVIHHLIWEELANKFKLRYKRIEN